MLTCEKIEAVLERIRPFMRAVLPVTLPPLRERREDIPTLMEHCFQCHFRQRGEDRPPISEGVTQAFMRYAWPGNVREFENMCERMAQTNTCGTLRTGCVAASILFNRSTLQDRINRHQLDPGSALRVVPADLAASA